MFGWLGRRKQKREEEGDGARRAVAWTRVASVSEIPPNTGKVVMVRGREVGVFNAGGRLYAIDNICPHNNRPIGTVGFSGQRVTCRWHALTFDLETGVCPEAPHYRVAMYRVRVEGDHIFLAPPA